MFCVAHSAGLHRVKHSVRKHPGLYTPAIHKWSNKADHCVLGAFMSLKCGDNLCCEQIDTNTRVSEYVTINHLLPQLESVKTKDKKNV